jgi:carbonic anhydrase
MSTQQPAPRATAAGSRIGRASGFELTGPDHPGAANVDAALERNRAFAAAGGHHGAVVFPNLSLFVITCLDPRVDPAHFLGLNLSDAMVLRNVGGRVTPEVINDVAFIGQLAESLLPDGPLFEVAVIHHTQCGTGALADDAFRRRYAERIGVAETGLRDHAVLDPAATVRHDVEGLRSAPAIPARIAFSGHVYDVVTGMMRTVTAAAEALTTPTEDNGAPAHLSLGNDVYGGCRDRGAVSGRSTRRPCRAAAACATTAPRGTAFFTVQPELHDELIPNRAGCYAGRPGGPLRSPTSYSGPCGHSASGAHAALTEPGGDGSLHRDLGRHARPAGRAVLPAAVSHTTQPIRCDTCLAASPDPTNGIVETSVTVGPPLDSSVARSRPLLAV